MTLDLRTLWVAVEIPGATKRRGDLDAAAAIRLSEWLRGYRPIQGIPDELFDTGRPREYWLNFLGDLAERERLRIESLAWRRGISATPASRIAFMARRMSVAGRSARFL